MKLTYKNIQRQSFLEKITKLLIDNDFNPKYIKVAIDYFYFNYSLNSIAMRTGVKLPTIRIIIDQVNGLMIGEKEKEVFADEMTLVGESFKKLYVVEDGGCVGNYRG